MDPWPRGGGCRTPTHTTRGVAAQRKLEREERKQREEEERRKEEERAPRPPRGPLTRAAPGLSRWPLTNVSFFPSMFSYLSPLSFPHFLHFLLQIVGLPLTSLFSLPFFAPDCFGAGVGVISPPPPQNSGLGIWDVSSAVFFHFPKVGLQFVGCWCAPDFFHSLPTQNTESAFPRGGMGRGFGKIFAPVRQLVFVPLAPRSFPTADRSTPPSPP